MDQNGSSSFTTLPPEAESYYLLMYLVDEALARAHAVYQGAAQRPRTPGEVIQLTPEERRAIGRELSFISANINVAPPFGYDRYLVPPEYQRYITVIQMRNERRETSDPYLIDGLQRLESGR